MENKQISELVALGIAVCTWFGIHDSITYRFTEICNLYNASIENTEDKHE